MMIIWFWFLEEQSYSATLPKTRGKKLKTGYQEKNLSYTYGYHSTFPTRWLWEKCIHKKINQVVHDFQSFSATLLSQCFYANDIKTLGNSPQLPRNWFYTSYFLKIKICCREVAHKYWNKRFKRFVNDDIAAEECSSYCWWMQFFERECALYPVKSNYCWWIAII